MKDNNLVRYARSHDYNTISNETCNNQINTRVLAACETMGNASTICCDKTGTLTTNRMTVVRAYSDRTDFTDPRRIASLPRAVIDGIARAIALNSQSKSIYTIQSPNSLPVQQGNKVMIRFEPFEPCINTDAVLRLSVLVFNSWTPWPVSRTTCSAPRPRKRPTSRFAIDRRLGSYHVLMTSSLIAISFFICEKAYVCCHSHRGWVSLVC